MSASNNSIPIPQSVTSFRINLFALLCFLAGLYTINTFNGSAFEANHSRLMLYKLCFLLLCWSLPVIVLELLYFRRLRHFDRSRLDWRRALIKTLGLYITLALCGLVYWVFPEYHGSFYNPYWELLRLLAPLVLIGSLPYFYLSDACLQEQNDGYYIFANGFLRLLSRVINGVKTSLILTISLVWLHHLCKLSRKENIGRSYE